MRKHIVLFLYAAFFLGTLSTVIGVPVIYLDGLVLPSITRAITPTDKKIENALIRAYKKQAPVAFLIPHHVEVTRLGCIGMITSHTPATDKNKLSVFTIALQDAIQIYNPEQKIIHVPVPGTNGSETEAELPANTYITFKVSPQANKFPSAQVEELFNILNRKYKKPALKKEMLDADGCNQCIQVVVQGLSLEITAEKAIDFITQNFSAPQKIALLVKLIFEQNKSIQATNEPSADTVTQFREKLTELNLPETQNTYFSDLIDRFERSQQNPHEGPSLETFLKFAFSLPWQDSFDTTPENYDLESVAKTLDEYQYGMDQVKDIVLTHLALRLVCPEGVPLTLCLVGSPGTGKTSISSKIAMALNKKMYRISLAGSHTQSDISGTSRTYLNSQEGKILKGLKTTGSASCVILLDEIDKMGNDNQWHGSPANALLHALDPEQNSEFFDEYLGIPFNISKVLFLATANNEREIPQALRDRMIIVHVPSYTTTEKINIAQTKIIPRLLSKMGLMSKQPTISADVIQSIINNYTFEDGLRGLTNQLNLLLGKYARGYLRGEDIEFTVDNLESYLGKAHNNLAEFKRQAKGIEPYLHHHARTKLFEAIEKFDQAKERTQEHEMLRNYIATFLSLPWKYEKNKTESYNLKEVAESIEKTHYGAKKVKDQVLDYLTLKQNQSDKSLSTTLCLLGAPGIGKTSIAESIAHALGKKVARISMGGISSIHDIRGLSSSYQNSKPSMLTEALKEAGTQDAIIILDEIDKIPNLAVANALLDVLDPTQNKAFFDDYLETSFDFSRIFFIATANDLSQVPYPLIDRMTLVEMDGYSEKQKIKIAQLHIIPKLLAQSGLNDASWITPELLHTIITNYTYESGVRQLTKRLKTLLARYQRSLDGETPLIFNQETLIDIFGASYDRKEKPSQDKVGVVNGLHASAAGGGVSFIQVTISAGSGKFIPSGLLERMTIESSEAAIKYIKSHITEIAAQYASYQTPITADILKGIDIYLHMPRSTPKDGNSAGLAFCTALISALTNRPINHLYAMTGEIDLMGNALAIGGLDKKLEGARHAGIRYVFVPEENRQDIQALSEIPEGLEIIFVRHISDILPRILLAELPLDPTSPLTPENIEAAAVRRALVEQALPTN